MAFNMFLGNKFHVIQHCEHKADIKWRQEDSLDIRDEIDEKKSHINCRRSLFLNFPK